MRARRFQVLVVAAMLWRHGGGVVPAAAGSTRSEDRAPRKSSPGGGRGRPPIKGPAGTAGAPLVYGYSLERTLDHSPEAFTQGLEFDRSCRKDASGKKRCEDVLWESTGMNGESSLREVSLATGEVRRKKMLEHVDFAEGVSKFGDRLFQLTWRTPKMFSYATDNFDDVQELQSPLTDGWGICTDGRSLIVSDSSPTLAWLDPSTLALQRTVDVKDGDVPVPWVNELEWVDGEIWGNVWQTPCIARIDPSSGSVLAWVILDGLMDKERQQHPGHRLDVLNGIAYDKRNQRLFVTGKWWHHLYQVQPQQSAGVSLEQARQFCIPRFRG